jgi:predicted HTH transcriptional regulator
VNTLVHADYTDRASILVVKDPAGFVFRNPGGMRVPAEQALRGGESDCRNRTLHKSQMNDDSVKGKICVMRG